MVTFRDIVWEQGQKASRHIVQTELRMERYKRKRLTQFKHRSCFSPTGAVQVTQNEHVT